MGNEHLYKILAIERIIQANPHGITTFQIIEKLENYYGIKAERKAIYSNMAVLTRFMPIYKKRDGVKILYCLAKE